MLDERGLARRRKAAIEKEVVDVPTRAEQADGEERSERRTDARRPDVRQTECHEVKLRCRSKSRMSFHRKLTAVVAAACLGAAVVAATSLAHRSSRTEDRVVWTHVGSLGYEVYLPDGYDTSKLRYPVIYFLHGLPANAGAFRQFGWLDNAMDAQQKQAILVIPQGASGANTDPEYLGRWETAIASDIPRAVDSRYRTIASRGGRAIIGLSAGGYGAMHLALAHLSKFSVVESWSGYFHPTDPTGTVILDLGSPARNARANVHRQALEARLDRLPLYIAFYVGRSDPLFVAENEQLNQELSAAGIAHVFRLYPGGHQQSLWSAHAVAWLTMALNHLAPAAP
jgi:S-formylglutathione hydrolase FrmB